MLHNLEILNGEMSPAFETNNLTYTVFIEDNINNLEISYDASEDISVNIVGNENLETDENIVYLELTKEGKVESTYTLEVTKEDTHVASKTILEPTTDITVKEELPSYVAPLIGGICFLLILLSFLIIFHKKKR